MLRMSFMDHLEELRARIIRIAIGLGVGFGVTLFFAAELFAQSAVFRGPRWLVASTCRATWQP